MLKTAILDSNRSRRQSLELLLEQDARAEKTEIFEDSKLCLQKLQKTGQDGGLLFLCTNMFHHEQLQEYLDELCESAPWIQVVCYAQSPLNIAGKLLMLPESVLGFLGMPFDPKQIGICIEQALCRKNPHRMIQIVRRGSQIFVRADSIIMIESQIHSVIITTARETYTVRKRLRDVLEELPDYFWQCHQSFAVNSRFIERYQGDAILLSTGQSVSVSRKYKTTIREAVSSLLCRTPSKD